MVGSENTIAGVPARVTLCTAVNWRYTIGDVASLGDRTPRVERAALSAGTDPGGDVLIVSVIDVATLAVGSVTLELMLDVVTVGMVVEAVVLVSAVAVAPDEVCC